MALEYIRTVDLSSLDADPLTQPAADTYGELLYAKGGRILVNAWQVSAPKGPPIAAAGTVDVVIATRSTDGPNGHAWGRGSVSLGATPGEWQTQSELGAVVAFTVAITGSSAGTGLVDIYAELDSRQEVP